MGLIGYGQMGQVAINAKGVKWRLGQKGQVAIKSAGTTLISEQMGHVDMGKMEKLPMGGGPHRDIFDKFEQIRSIGHSWKVIADCQVNRNHMK